MASNISGAFDIFVAHICAVCESQILKITAGFRYMGNERRIHFLGGYRFRFLNDVAYPLANYGLSCANIFRDGNNREVTLPH
jgi:Golgi nucleoside diphosphatase